MIWFRYKYPLHIMIKDAMLVAEGKGFMVYHPERFEPVSFSDFLKIRRRNL